MSYKLKVEKYGKIESAEIEVFPLTLFVGDNNSGKSYLLSLIWAILSGEQDTTVFSGMQKVLINKHRNLYYKLVDFVKDFDVSESNQFDIDERDIIKIVNNMLNKNKDSLVKNLFNYDGMQIGKIEIAKSLTRRFVLYKKETESARVLIEVKVAGEQRKMAFDFPKNEDLAELVSIQILRSIAEIILKDDKNQKGTYYLPAARTGFMLAKNTINQVGRKQTFDIVEIKQSNAEAQMSPFPKTIIHFLDSIDNLNMQKEEKKFSEIVKWIIENMSKGDVECVDENSGNVQYIPEGMGQGIPLRATSGVVTELTPLILLLKYSKLMECICYEEPEMCLHPQLQLQMARLLVQMVNKGINIIATTHSDIIVQHVNNVCQLNSIGYNAFLDKIKLSDKDLIDTNNVAIYQFKDNGEKTLVERVMPKENIFEVTSFMSALKKILEQTINVTNIVNGEEE